MNNLSSPIFKFSENDLNSQEQIIFYQYWLKLKGNKNVPKRSDFNPMDIPKALPFVIMASVLSDPARIKLRLIGSRCDVPVNYSGKCLDEFPVLKPLNEMHLKNINSKKPFIYSNSLELAQDTIKRYSSVVVPFSSDGENIDIIMSCHCEL
ncbi:MAG: PAS domain-containing protein [Kordiimonadaceae bacterium]|jgi:hypothetical protein|nr:PAS domain-containing protein [Kordiimonadaceae bacterium]MBT6032798.1 PAS domain-containing protein [Kordiimonadaceae bacterium]